MNAIIKEWTVDNAAWTKPRRTPRLSVLIPFLNDDPRRLLTALDSEAKVLRGAVEIVVLDDGTGDDEMAQEITAAVEQLKLPVRLISLLANEGRAKGRNRLAGHARGGHLLFLDSDMLPDAPDFLRRYVQLVRGHKPAVVFGGFSLDQAPRRREHALHRALAMRSECAPAAVRGRTPEKYVFTSNLLIRRDVFEAERFDEGFRGWGWEDVEWGVRVSRRFDILHIDNPATHLGLDPPEMIAEKYEQSAGNFARIVAAHPEVVRTYPSYKAARLLKRAPLRGVWRPMLKIIALSGAAPMPLRTFCMRLYRAALCAEAV